MSQNGHDSKNIIKTFAYNLTSDVDRHKRYLMSTWVKANIKGGELAHSRNHDGVGVITIYGSWMKIKFDNGNEWDVFNSSFFDGAITMLDKTLAYSQVSTKKLIDELT